MSALLPVRILASSGTSSNLSGMACLKALMSRRIRCFSTPRSSVRQAWIRRWWTPQTAWTTVWRLLTKRISKHSVWVSVTRPVPVSCVRRA